MTGLPLCFLQDVIHNDFVLVSGDTVSNVILGPALEAHRARRATDKNAIFTMVCWGISGGLALTLACQKHGACFGFRGRTELNRVPGPSKSNPFHAAALTSVD